MAAAVAFRDLRLDGLRFFGFLGLDYSGKLFTDLCKPVARQQKNHPRPLAIVSIVVPVFGLTKSIFRTLKGNPKKELQWRL